MKGKVSLILILMFIAVSVSALTVNAEIEKTGSATVDVMSNYVWRGQTLSDDVVVQPSVGITYGGFGANLWANYNTDTEAELDETDVTLNYSFSVNKLSFDTGYIYYALSGTNDDGSGNDTQEIYLSLGVDVILGPAITVYYDFDAGDGAFIVASIGHSFELPKKLAIDIGASVSYNATNTVMGTDADGEEFSDFYNADISTSLTVPITDAISFAPMVAYSIPLSDDAEDVLEGVALDVTGEAEADIVYGGVNLSLSF